MLKHVAHVLLALLVARCSAQKPTLPRLQNDNATQTILTVTVLASCGTENTTIFPDLFTSRLPLSIPLSLSSPPPHPSSAGKSKPSDALGTSGKAQRRSSKSDSISTGGSVTRASRTSSYSAIRPGSGSPTATSGASRSLFTGSSKRLSGATLPATDRPSGKSRSSLPSTFRLSSVASGSPLSTRTITGPIATTLTTILLEPDGESTTFVEVVETRKGGQPSRSSVSQSQVQSAPSSIHIPTRSNPSRASSRSIRTGSFSRPSLGTDPGGISIRSSNADSRTFTPSSRGPNKTVSTIVLGSSDVSVEKTSSATNSPSARSDTSSVSVSRTLSRSVSVKSASLSFSVPNLQSTRGLSSKAASTFPKSSSSTSRNKETSTVSSSSVRMSNTPSTVSRPVVRNSAPRPSSAINASSGSGSNIVPIPSSYRSSISLSGRTISTTASRSAADSSLKPSSLVGLDSTRVKKSSSLSSSRLSSSARPFASYELGSSFQTPRSQASNSNSASSGSTSLGPRSSRSRLSASATSAFGIPMAPGPRTSSLTMSTTSTFLDVVSISLPFFLSKSVNGRQSSARTAVLAAEQTSVSDTVTMGSSSLDSTASFSTLLPSTTADDSAFASSPALGFATIFTSQNRNLSGSASPTQPRLTVPVTISTIPPSGTVSGTYVVQIPLTETITLTTSYDSTNTADSTTFLSTDPLLVTEKIFTPAPTTVYVTTGYTGLYNTSSIVSTPGARTVTIVVETPLPFVTVLTGYDEGPSGTDVITSTVGYNASLSERQVLISTPYPYTTQTTTFNGVSTVTATLAPTPLDFIGTVLISVPATFTTVIFGYDEGPRGTDLLTSTVLPTNPTDLVTIAISTPYPYIDATTFTDGGPRFNATNVITVHPSATAGLQELTGTLLTATPAPYLTSLVGFDGGPRITDNITTDIPAVSGTGTEIVSVPFAYISSTSGRDAGPSDLNTITSTITQSASASDSVMFAVQTVTLLIITPYRYVTSTSSFATDDFQATVTTQIIPPSPTSFIGTVSLLIPDIYEISYSGYDGGNTESTTRTTSLSISSGRVSSLVVFVTPFPYVTTTVGTDEGPSGSQTFTSTVRPTSDSIIGSILILTPDAYVITTVPYDEGPGGTDVVTRTAVNSGNATLARSIIVSTPYQYNTITTDYDGGTEASTVVTSIAASISPPGILVTSKPDPYVTTTTDYDAGEAGVTNVVSSITVVLSAATRGGTGTVLVSTPDLYTTLTTYTDEGPFGNTTSTITTPASLASDRTGSIVVFVPAPYKTSYSQYSGASISSSTILASDASGTGTLVIFQPSPTPISVSYITVTSGYPRPTTSYSTPGVTGNPVTVVVFTPDNTASLTSAVVTSTSTTYTGTDVSTTTTTATNGTSVIVKTYATCDTSCNNQGIRYAVYENPYSDQATNGYTSFNSSFFKRQQPIAQGITKYLGFAANIRNPSPYGPFITNIYDQPPQSISNLAVDHTFYLCAPVSGNYSFNGIYSDDITQIWLGDHAISGWTRSNEDLEQTFNYDYYSSAPASFTALLTQGYLYPIRIMWGNRYGDSELNVAIYAPDGGLLVSSNTTDSPYTYTSPNILLSSCDGTAPPFPAWGLET